MATAALLEQLKADMLKADMLKADMLKADTTARLASSRDISEKIDTSTWNDKDLIVFDSLIAERRNAEKDHHKFSIDYKKRKVTSRDLKAPNDWKYDNETAGYRYVGQANLCPMDIDIPGGRPCRHEICKQAKTTNGISYLEYDTVTHYAYRILNSKTIRMKNALRKQRDIQLLKDRQLELEWREKAIKKFKRFGKEAGEAILAAAERFDKSRDPSLSPERPDNAVEQVGRAISRRRADILPDTAKLFLETASRRLQNADDPDGHWHNPVQYVEFLQNVQLNHLEAVMMNIRDVLQISAVIDYEIDYRLRAFLEQFRPLVKCIPRSVKNHYNYTVLDAFQAIIQLMRAQEEAPTADSDKLQPQSSYLYHTLARCAAIDRDIERKTKQVSSTTLAPKDLNNQMVLLSKDDMMKSPLFLLSRSLLEGRGISFDKIEQASLPKTKANTARGSLTYPLQEITELEHDALFHFANDLQKHMVYFSRTGDGLHNFIMACYDEGWTASTAMLRLAIILRYLNDENPCTARGVLSRLSAMIDDNAPGLPQGWVPYCKGIGYAILHTWSYLMLEASHCYGRYDVEEYAYVSTFLLVCHVLRAYPDGELVHTFEEKLQVILNIIQPRTRPSWTASLLRVYEQMLLQIPHEPDFSSKNPEVGITPLPQVREITVHSGQPRIRSQNPTDELIALSMPTFLRVCKDACFSSEVTARILKYIALWIRSSSPYPSKRSLNLLWHMFLRMEAKFKLTPGMQTTDLQLPEQSSLNLGMHNHCNIWELDDDKLTGFFSGYSSRYRDERHDVSALVSSFKIYRQQLGIQDRLSDKVHDMMSHKDFPEVLRQVFTRDDILPQRYCYGPESVQDTVNCLDYVMYLIMPEIDYPTVSFIQALLRRPAEYDRYFTCLAYLLNILGLEEDAAKVEEAATELQLQYKNGDDISETNADLVTVLRIAADTYSKTDHIDIIYSDYEGNGASDNDSDSDSDSDSCKDLTDAQLMKRRREGLADGRWDTSSSDEDEEEPSSSNRTVPESTSYRNTNNLTNLTNATPQHPSSGLNTPPATNSKIATNDPLKDHLSTLIPFSAPNPDHLPEKNINNNNAPESTREYTYLPPNSTIPAKIKALEDSLLALQPFEEIEQDFHNVLDTFKRFKEVLKEENA
ncbi:hypothetical protein LTR64_002899 [Lithohypha guttulata]|uniref:uncharacterized protein n=1 Tax=Lithohypha guttulata TaxID=1690604 RepID=UPI00315CA40F